MAISAQRLEFWKDVICTRCCFPAPRALRAQFAHATLHDFCPCGCVSFAVTVEDGAPVRPIAKPGNPGLAHEAGFYTDPEGMPLDILLFVDERGNLSYVEIDCCANAYPVPDDVALCPEPYNIATSDRCLTEEP